MRKRATVVAGDAWLDGLIYQSPAFQAQVEEEWAAINVAQFQQYDNGHHTHAGLEGRTPDFCPDTSGARASLRAYRWQPPCRGCIIRRGPRDTSIRSACKLANCEFAIHKPLRL